MRDAYTDNGCLGLCTLPQRETSTEQKDVGHVPPPRICHIFPAHPSLSHFAQKTTVAAHFEQSKYLLCRNAPRSPPSDAVYPFFNHGRRHSRDRSAWIVVMLAVRLSNGSNQSHTRQGWVYVSTRLTRLTTHPCKIVRVSLDLRWTTEA